MKAKNRFVVLMLFFTQLVHAQLDELPFLQPFVKVGYGYVDSSRPMHVLNSEVSLYINSFGNTIGCYDMTLGGCLITNLFFMISAFEISGGVEAALHNNNSYLIPKAGFYLRPLYFGKAGVNISPMGVNLSAGISIPTKKNYMIELLYQSHFQNFERSPLDEHVSKFQLSIQIPIKADLTSRKKTKNEMF